MKYDDASWHYGGDFPAGLPQEAGGTHFAMFLAWAATSGLVGEFHLLESADGLSALTSRSITPGAFFFKYCDGKLTDEDLSAEGNQFAIDYVSSPHGRYFADYVEMLPDGLPSAYHAPDTWETFETIKPMLDERLATWRSAIGKSDR